MWHSASVSASFTAVEFLPLGIVYLFVFVLGLMVGSFLNVCIRRLPKEAREERSIVRPRSHCPRCKTPIAWYDNVPLISYLVLRGKCRACQAPISAVYPAVELLTGLLLVACVGAFGLTLEATKWSVFVCLLVVLVFTDVFERILPDAVNFFGLGVGLVLSFVLASPDGAAEWLARRLFEFPPPEPALSFVDALLGAGLGGGLLWLVGEVYLKLRGREGMGLGDVKMMAMVGTFLGPQRTLLTILVGSLLGSVIGLLFIRLRRKGTDYELPFGAFLGVAAVLVVFFGDAALGWYLRISGLR